MRHRRRRRHASFEGAAEVVSRSLTSVGLAELSRQVAIARAWPQAVGPQIAARTAVNGFSHGTLQIKAYSTAWQNELNFLKATIIAKLNPLLPAPWVQSIRVLSGQAPRQAPPPAPKQAPSAAAQAAAEALAAPIADDALRRAFAAMVLKQWDQRASPPPPPPGRPPPH